MIFRNNAAIIEVIPSNNYKTVTSNDDEDGCTNTHQAAMTTTRKNSTSPSCVQKVAHLRSSSFVHQRTDNDATSREDDVFLTVKEYDVSRRINTTPLKTTLLHKTIPDLSFQRTMRYVTRQVKSDKLPTLTHHVTRLWREEGRKLKMTFLRHMLQVTQIVNDVIGLIPTSVFPFKIKPVSIDDGFEKRGEFTVDFYLVLEDVDVESSRVDFTASDVLTASVTLPDEEESIKNFCSKPNSSGEWLLSPNLLLNMLTESIDTYVRPKYEQHFSPGPGLTSTQRATVHFENINKDVVLHIYFARKRIIFEVRLIIALDVRNNLPVNPHSNHVSNVLRECVNTAMTSGVYLLARAHDYHDHLWEVSFSKARRHLISQFDGDGATTTLLLALGYVNEMILSESCSEMLLPLHFQVLLVWMHVATPHYERQRTEKYIAYHFLRLLNGLKQCITERQCNDFFSPNVNHFAAMSESSLAKVLVNLNRFMRNLGVEA